MNIEENKKEIINKILRTEETTRKEIARRVNVCKKIIYILRTISILTLITLILSLCNVIKVVTSDTIMLAFTLIGLPLGISEVFNLEIKRCKNSFKNDIKSKIMPTLIQQLSNIEKTNNAFNIQDLKNSGLFLDDHNYEEDDAFIFNYKNKKAYISEGETYEYSSKNHQRRNRRRWLLIGFYTEKNIYHQTVIKPKTFNENQKKYLPIIMMCCFFMSFLIFWSRLYYIDLSKNADTYLTNPTQCIINIGFPIFMALAVLIVFSLPFIIKTKPWIKKEGVVLEDILLMKNFDIKSSHQIEARYYLTPSFIEKFHKVQQIFDAKDIRCSFYKNKVILAIGINEDLFEVANLDEPLRSHKYIRKTIKQLNTIKKIIVSLDEDK